MSVSVNFKAQSRTHAVPTTKPTPPQVKASLMRETSSAADRLGRTTNDVESMSMGERAKVGAATVSGTQGGIGI